MTFKHFIRTSDDRVGGINSVAALWWGGALLFSAIGVLCYWGASALEMTDLYKVACLFLVLSLIWACLGELVP
jgi:hypothetical protein